MPCRRLGSLVAEGTWYLDGMGSRVPALEDVAAADPGRGSRTRVLLAEDNVDLRCFIATVLRVEGYEVIEADDGDELQRVVTSLLRCVGDDRAPRAIPIHVIVSDIRMPGHSPLDTLATVQRAGGGVPVILITALDDEYTHAEAARLGVTALFHKPFDPDHLRAAISALVPPWDDDPSASGRPAGWMGS